MPDTAAAQRTRYPLAAYNYRVDVGGLTMGFSEVSGLTVEYETLTYQHGLSYWEGQKITRFRFDRYVEITLRKGVLAGSTAVYQWLAAVDKKSLSVALCDEKGQPAVSWRIQRALVTKLEAPKFDASSNEVAIETLTLMVSGISIETP